MRHAPGAEPIPDPLRPAFSCQGWDAPRPFRLLPELPFDHYQSLLEREIALVDREIRRLGFDAEPLPCWPPISVVPDGSMPLPRAMAAHEAARNPNRGHALYRILRPVAACLALSDRLHPRFFPPAAEEMDQAPLADRLLGRSSLLIFDDSQLGAALAAAAGGSATVVCHYRETGCRFIGGDRGTLRDWLIHDGPECAAEDAALVMRVTPETRGVVGWLRGRLRPGQCLFIHGPQAAQLAAEWGGGEALGAGWFFAHPPVACVERPWSGGTMEWPRISVVVVSFNQAGFLRECLDSVLDQGYPNLECIVVDGGSTDGSAAILRSYEPRLAALVIEPDEGQSDALCKGFARATGVVMNWLCSDDRLEPESLFWVGWAHRRFGSDLIAGGCRRIGAKPGEVLFDHNNILPIEQPVRLSLGELLQFMGRWQRGDYFFQPELFFTRGIWEAAGGFIQRRLYHAMDYELWLRFAMAGARVVNLPAFIGASREHEAQKTRSDKRYMPQIRGILEEYRLLLRAAAAVAE